HWQIEAGRHSVVEEARVSHLVLGIEEVFFIERPTYSLDRASLHLSLHIARMHGLAGILNGGVTEDGCLAGFRINLDIRDMDAERVGEPLWRDRGPSHDRIELVFGNLGRDLLERKRLSVVAISAVVHLHAGRIAIPDRSGSLLHLF